MKAAPQGMRPANNGAVCPPSDTIARLQADPRFAHLNVAYVADKFRRIKGRAPQDFELERWLETETDPRALRTVASPSHHSRTLPTVPAAPLMSLLERDAWTARIQARADEIRAERACCTFDAVEWAVDELMREKQ